MTLYLKYRPKNLDELDLPEVAATLKKIVKSGSIPHAFLFSGPKGAGKTSAARILSKIINCEHLGQGFIPCEKCDQCRSITSGSNLDVIEMDAASHRGIDDVRALKDAVKLSPTKANKKIYIIDEAHMLTLEASNALLKTLEEPPEHVVFILATTNPEKLIETIRSRTSQIVFRKGTIPEIVRSLVRVAKKEKIKVKDEALSVIAETSGGSFRDAIKSFELSVTEGIALTKDGLEKYFFAKDRLDISEFIQLLSEKNTAGLLSSIEMSVKSGVPVDFIIKALIQRLQSALLAKVGVAGDDIPEMSKGDLMILIELLGKASLEVSQYPIEELPLQIAVIKWGEAGVLPQEEKQSNGHKVIEEKVAVEKKTISNKEKVVATPKLNIETSNVNEEAWKTILSTIKPVNASIEALLRAAKPVNYDGQTLTLGVFYKFHKERLEDGEHRRVLEAIVAQVLGSPTKVVCILVEPPPKKIIEEAKVESVLTEGKDADIIKVAEEIFGN